MTNYKKLQFALEDAMEAHFRYTKACEEVYDALLGDCWELQEMLKIGKRGSSTRREDRRLAREEANRKRQDTNSHINCVSG